MPLNPLIVAFVVITLIDMIIAGLMLYIMRKRVQNPAQWKTVKRVSEWFDTDPITGDKIKRTQTEFYRVRA